MLAGVTDCSRSQKWGCRGKLALGFKPRHGSQTREREPGGFGKEGRGPRGFGGEEKGERGPHSFGGVGGENHAALAEWGPRGWDTADGAGSLNHRLLLLFLRYGTPDRAEEEGRTVWPPIFFGAAWPTLFSPKTLWSSPFYGCHA